jgi:hypothetical protein
VTALALGALAVTRVAVLRWLLPDDEVRLVRAPSAAAEADPERSGAPT